MKTLPTIPKKDQALSSFYHRVEKDKEIKLQCFITPILTSMMTLLIRLQFFGISCALIGSLHDQYPKNRINLVQNNNS